MRIRRLLAVAALAAGMVVSVVQPAAAETTTQVQWDVAGIGYLAFGDIDGVTGPKTSAAVKAFQTDRCLDVDGVWLGR